MEHASPSWATTTDNVTGTKAALNDNDSANDNDAVFQNPFDRPPVRVTFILLYTIVFAMCFMGNIVVLIVFAHSKRMRTRTNLFLANLAVADFCVGVFCVLPSLSLHLSPFWTLGQVMCKLYFFVNYLAYTASILLLVVIAVERYIAIMHPLRSRGYFTAPRLLAAQVIVWVVAAVYNIPILMMFDTLYTPSGAFCFITLSLMNLKAYYTAHFMLWYLLPLTVILVMYGRISCTLWATSSGATTPTTRADSRNSLSTDFAQDSHHPHHHNHRSLGATAHKAIVPGRSCLSYCERGGENGFGSVVTVGLLDGGREGKAWRGDTRAAHSTKSRLMDIEDGARRSACKKSQESDRTAPRILYSPQSCVQILDPECSSDCLNCMQGRPSPIHHSSESSSQRLDSVPLHYTTTTTSKGSSNKRLNVDDYAYELSDIHSSDDYDSCQSQPRGEGGIQMITGLGNGNNFKVGNGNSGPRRLRTQCRISSQRGLTSRRRVIRLLLAVVTIFAICLLPFHLRNLLHYWDVDPAGSLLDFLSPIASVMMYLNCGFNPVIYWMFSDHFRRSLKETFCFWKRGRRNSSRILLSSPRRQNTSTLRQYDVM